MDRHEFRHARDLVRRIPNGALLSKKAVAELFAEFFMEHDPATFSTSFFLRTTAPRRRPAEVD